MSRTLRTPVARALGAAIGRARTEAGVGVRELARLAGKNGAWVNRLERGEVEFSEEILNELADLLEVSLDVKRRWLDRFADLRVSPWTPSAAIDDELSALISYEVEADHIVNVSSYIPGLLQTRDYATAVITADDEASNIGDLLYIRAGRQGVLTGRRAPRYTAFLDEAALARPAGSSEVMSDQIRYMLRVSEEPNITVRIISFSAGCYLGQISPFMLLTFPENETSPLVYLENLRTASWLDRERDTEIFVRAVEKLHTIALNVDESNDVLLKYQAKYDEESHGHQNLA
ncbi:hypothetical protein C1701_21665 [Actinoalloteichus sp. AHMU CJ021]|uniref:helix-turn-helix domain-containing protein n=1 Tax=Actinoalloteichus sp. AHMU CJ021 TaxID=2072503 RepID=UPI000CA0769E|nr:hypothetical protein C1701_21665 [Actinoalloteichus sp. AHMU CJ021]